jgi:DNA replication licensing factor MCM4
LDFRNLKAYPPTKKLWQQAQDYPQDIVTLMDQGIKDVMYELAEAEMAKQRQSQSSAGQGSQRSRVLSSEPPVPSSDRGEPEGQTPREQQQQDSGEVDLCQEVQKRSYRVRPFGMDSTVNMRDLNPSGMFLSMMVRFMLISPRCRQDYCRQRPCHSNNAYYP